MYKWLVPTKTFQVLRSAIEYTTSQPIDWEVKESSRNELVFFSAQPLAKLYEPIIHQNVTFILHEYFVPKSKGLEWFKKAKSILFSWSNQPRYFLAHQNPQDKGHHLSSS